MDKRNKIKEIREILRREFEENKGVASLVHDPFHSYSVAYYASWLARYLAIKEGVKEEDEIAFLAEVAGLLHDIGRVLGEDKKHAEASRKYILESERVSDILTKEEIEILADVVGFHSLSYPEVVKIFPEDSIRNILIRAIVMADRLEVDGPRGIERGSFFAGKERVLRGDLKGRFKYPNESYEAVLGTGLVIVYGTNHVRNYPEELKPWVDELRSWQYPFGYGLLVKANKNGKIERIDEVSAWEYFNNLSFPGINIAKDSVKERHLSGKYFKKEEYPRIAKSIEDVLNANPNQVGEDAYRLVYEIVTSESPEEWLERVSEIGVEESYYCKWVQGIRDYRSGRFMYELGDKLISKIRCDK